MNSPDFIPIPTFFLQLLKTILPNNYHYAEDFTKTTLIAEYLNNDFSKQKNRIVLHGILLPENTGKRIREIEKSKVGFFSFLFL